MVFMCEEMVFGKFASCVWDMKKDKHKKRIIPSWERGKQEYSSI